MPWGATVLEQISYVPSDTMHRFMILESEGSGFQSSNDVSKSSAKRMHNPNKDTCFIIDWKEIFYSSYLATEKDKGESVSHFFVCHIQHFECVSIKR